MGVGQVTSIRRATPLSLSRRHLPLTYAGPITPHLLQYGDMSNSLRWVCYELVFPIKTLTLYQCPKPRGHLMEQTGCLDPVIA